MEVLSCLEVEIKQKNLIAHKCMYYRGTIYVTHSTVTLQRFNFNSDYPYTLGHGLYDFVVNETKNRKTALYLKHKFLKRKVKI